MEKNDLSVFLQFCQQNTSKLLSGYVNPTPTPELTHPDNLHYTSLRIILPALARKLVGMKPLYCVKSDSMADLVCDIEELEEYIQQGKIIGINES